MKNNSPFTNKQLEAISHIRNWLMQKSRTPSIRELMAELGYKSPRSVQDILQQLEEKGVIKKLDKGDYQLVMDPDLGPMHAQTTNTPLLGVVSCGMPILAEENIEGYLVAQEIEVRSYDVNKITDISRQSTELLD